MTLLNDNEVISEPRDTVSDFLAGAMLLIIFIAFAFGWLMGSAGADANRQNIERVRQEMKR